MGKKLIFFHKEEFSTYKSMMTNKGYIINSITKYLNSNDILEHFDYQSEIIDVSSLTFAFKNDNLSFQLEQLLPFFSDETIFIADLKYEEVLTYELRYCIDEFEELEIELPKDNKPNNGVSKSFVKKRIIDLKGDDLKNFWNEFNGRLYGHQKFKDDFFKLVNVFNIFNALGEHKILSLFVLGDSGVGKTEIARVLQKCLKGKNKLAKINFGNYSSKDALNSLIGSPRGYIGSETGELFEKVKESDVGLILIDEFEKGDTAVFNYFLEVLENGKMTNSQGEEIDLNGYTIIFTSNISKENFKKVISPELRSRFNYKVHFSLLFNNDKDKFVRYRLGEIMNKFETKFNLEFPNDTHDNLVSKIEVSKFKNMRDLNKEIKDRFVEYITQTVIDTDETLEINY
ncbi:AAA family ATPase [Epilithonimonas sp.]|uniref:AAA family ATPase n=1 Tax=Epilithonimonas sp. TaxID=2894511 RepID=UPI00289F9BD5|nr:AAA family ATPase [Epilithonimonas sp.]